MAGKPHVQKSRSKKGQKARCPEGQIPTTLPISQGADGVRTVKWDVRLFTTWQLGQHDVGSHERVSIIENERRVWLQLKNVDERTKF